MRPAELRGDRLGQDDGAGGPERPHGGIVAAGKVPAKRRAPHLGGHGGCLEQVLDADRHAVDCRECPAVLPAPGAGVGPGARPFLVHGGERLDHRFTLGDGLETGFQVLARRRLTARHPVDGVAPGEAAKGCRVVGHWHFPRRLVATGRCPGTPARTGGSARFPRFSRDFLQVSWYSSKSSEVHGSLALCLRPRQQRGNPAREMDRPAPACSRARGTVVRLMKVRSERRFEW